MSVICGGHARSYSPCCCCYCCCRCDTPRPKPIVKKRSRFGDIFKGQTPKLEDFNSYRKKNKGGSPGGKNEKKGGGGNKKRKGGGGKRGRKKKKGKGGGMAGGTAGREGGGGQGGENIGGIEGGTNGERGEGGAGGGYTGGKGGGGQGGEYGGGKGVGGGGGGYGSGGDQLGGGKSKSAGEGDATGVPGAPGRPGTSGVDGGGDKFKWRADNECTPNQQVKCPHTCTLRPKKCMPNQTIPCNEACLKGKPYIEQQTLWNNPQMPVQNQHDGGYFCARGGLQVNYSQMQGGGFNWANTTQILQPQPQLAYCSGNQQVCTNYPPVPQTFVNLPQAGYGSVGFNAQTQYYGLQQLSSAPTQMLDNYLQGDVAKTKQFLAACSGKSSVKCKTCGRVFNNKTNVSLTPEKDNTMRAQTVIF